MRSAYDSALRLPGADGLHPTVPESDRVEPPRIPWRRYFARHLDQAVITLVVTAVLALAFRVNFSKIPALGEWLLVYVYWALLIPLEALLLSRFGTTPGKWLMGIRLEHADGRRLTFSQAAVRAWDVFGRGMGYNIPIYNLYRQWKSYKDVRDGDGPEWDGEVTLAAAGCRWWRTAAYLAACALVCLLAVWAALTPGMPANRGDELTVEEFVENYNQLERFYYDTAAETLQTDGTFLRKESVPGQVVSYWNGEDGDTPLVLQFTEEEGVLTEVSFTRRESTFSIGTSQRALKLSAMAFAWADSGAFAAVRSERVLDRLLKLRDGTMEEELFGCRLTYTVTGTGTLTNDLGQVWGETYEVSLRMERLT